MKLGYFLHDVGGLYRSMLSSVFKDNESASQEGSAAEDDGAVAGTSSPKGKRVRQRRQD